MSPCTDVENIYLPLIPVGNVRDVVTSELPALDDTVSDAINIPPFPFGDSIQTRVFVSPCIHVEKTNILFCLWV